MKGAPYLKTLWVPLGILVVMFFALMYNVQYLRGFVEPLYQELETAAQLVSEGEWQKAETLTREVHEAWHEKRTYLHITLRHDDLDGIYVLLEEVLAYLEQEKIGSYMASNQALVAKLKLLCEMEELSLHNAL